MADVYKLVPFKNIVSRPLLYCSPKKAKVLFLSYAGSELPAHLQSGNSECPLMKKEEKEGASHPASLVGRVEAWQWLGQCVIFSLLGCFPVVPSFLGPPKLPMRENCPSHPPIWSEPT